MVTSLNETLPKVPYKGLPAKRESRLGVRWPGLWILACGTGGILAPQTLAHHEWGTSQYLQVWIAPPATVDRRSIRDHLINIRDVLGLNMTELAKLFGVTRPAAYAWLEGASPKSDTRNAIYALSRAADRLINLGVSRPDLYAHMPIIEGKSLVEILMTKADSSSAFEAIEELARTDEQVRQQAPSRRVRKSKRNYESLDALATPITMDRA